MMKFDQVEISHEALLGSLTSAERAQLATRMRHALREARDAGADAWTLTELIGLAHSTELATRRAISGSGLTVMTMNYPGWS